VNRIGFIEKLTSGAFVYRLAKAVDRAAMEWIEPVIGEPVTLAKLKKIFEEFRGADFLIRLSGAKEESFAKQLVEERIRILKNRRIEVLNYDSNALTRKLRPGDVIFKKIDEANSHIVVTGQWLFQPFISGKKEREAYKYSHVALYIGDGKIAEAVPHAGGSEVRILKLDDPRFALDTNCKNEYLVARPKDASLGLEAAEVAARVAQEAAPVSEEFQRETPFKYNKIQAIRSIWHSASFGPFARYRYLKQYIDDHRKQLPRDFLGLKSFFCSYFVGYAYQTAESRRIMPKLLGRQDGPPLGITRFDTAVFRGLWARLRRFQVWGQMSRHVQMQFDAKRMTPQDLRNFMVRNRNLFEDQFLISRAKPSSPLSRLRTSLLSSSASGEVL